MPSKQPMRFVNVFASELAMRSFECKDKRSIRSRPKLG